MRRSVKRVGMIKLFGYLLTNFFKLDAYKDPHSPVLEFNPPKEKPKDMLKPLPGNDWNPFAKYPRNEPCYCGSKIKAKKCCLLNEDMAINAEMANKVKPLIKQLRAR